MGSIISRLIYYEEKLGLSKYNAIMPIIFGTILIMSYELLGNNEAFLGIFAFRMVVKNITYIKNHGLLIRTTHMTGYLSDSAFIIGSIIRGYGEEI